MLQRIYADNAATTKLDKTAFDAMLPWLLEEYGNASQPYSFARKTKQALVDARSTIAKCIGASPDEIFFTSGGTESDNWVIKSSAFSDPNRSAMITSAFEHHAILNSCAAIERLGYPVAYMWPSSDGYITEEILEDYISSSTRLVSVMYVNNELGTIQPIKELCKIAHQNGALFHTDAVQAVGHIKIDVHDLGVDFLSASAHKFNGPKGIGFLYIRNGIQLMPYADGGTQESAHRAGTENVAAIMGMATALLNNCDRLSDNITKIKELEYLLLEEMKNLQIPFRRNGGSLTLPGLVSLSFEGMEGETILHRLDLLGISVSTGSACDSVNTDVSHVLKAIQLEKSFAIGTIRVSLGKYNSVSDIKKIVMAIRHIVS